MTDPLTDSHLREERATPRVDDDIERVLITESELQDRVAALADEMARAFAGREGDVVIVAVLAGSIIFLADLMRRLPMKMRIGLITVSSYAGPTTESKGAVLQPGSLPELRGRNVLIIDDILDTGRTLRVVQEEVRQAKPNRVETAVLLRKRGRTETDVPVEYVGFDIEDVFVVGYGLDYNGLYRNLPYVAVPKRSALG